MRLTQRHPNSFAYVPGYAPKCADAETCELLVKVTERLAVFEDIWDKYQEHILPSLSSELFVRLKETEYERKLN